MRNHINTIKTLFESQNVLYEDDDGLVIIENPSKNQFVGLMARSERQKLRGLLQESLVIWDAYLATHAEVIRLLENELGMVIDGADLELEPDEIIMNSFWSEMPMDSRKTLIQARKTAKWLRKELRRFYPAATSVTLVQDGTYDSLTV